MKNKKIPITYDVELIIVSRFVPMKLTLLIVLSTVTACTILTKRQRTAQVHAVSDGKLTLGAVPSENEAGLSVYRLILCKNFSTFEASMLTNDKVCQAALVDDLQREVIIVPDKLRRSFATKLHGHTLAIAGVAALTLAVVGASVYKLSSKASKGAKELGKKIGVDYEKPLAAHKDKYTAVVADVEKELQKIKVSEGKKAELEKVLHQSLETANEHHLNELLANIRAIDAEAANKLEAGVFGGRVDPNILESFASRVEKLDTSFAKKLREAKVINQPLNDDGLLYFSTRANKMLDIKNKNIDLNKKLNNLLNKKEISADYFDENEKLFLLQLHHKLSNLFSASLLHSLEVEKDLLLKLKNKEIGLEHVPTVLKEEMQAITDKYTWSIDNVAEYHLSAGDAVTKITQAAPINSINSYGNLLQSYEMVGNLSFEEFSLLGKRDAYRNAMHNVVRHVGSSSLEGNINNRVRQLNLRIAKTRETLLNSTLDSVEEGHYVTREVKMWSELESVINKSTKYRHERLTLIRQEIARFSQDIAADRKKLSNMQDTVEKMRVENAERKKLILELHDKELQKLRTAEEQLRSGRDEKFAALSKNAEANRRKWLSLGAGAGGVGAVVMVAIDKSIWGYGERQLGEHWHQIFSEEASFNNATPVKDLNGVLEKLATVFGFKINKSALSLAD